jgi:hypothetical protein
MHTRFLAWWLVAIAALSGGCGDDDAPAPDAGHDAGKRDAGAAGAGAGAAAADDAGAHARPAMDAGDAGDAEPAGDDDGGSEPVIDAGESGACEGPLLPLAVGNSWTYRVTHPVDGVSTKTTRVEDEQLVGGTGPFADRIAFHVVTTKMSSAGTDRTESWQGVRSDSSVVRYREVSFKAGTMTVNGEEFWEPYKLRIDESPAHVLEGATWHEKYTETKVKGGVATPTERDDAWVVDATDVPCGPVQGRMLSCLKVRKKSDGAAEGKTYLYARCVGKVREEGAQTEELVDYSVE